MEDNEKLSAERSLKIISEAIERSRTDITAFSVASVVPANFALMYPGPYESLAICITSLFILVIPGIIINRQYKK